MNYDEEITTHELLHVLQKLYNSEFKFSKITYYIRKGLFPFIESNVGVGNVRKFSLYDVIAMVCLIEVYQRFKDSTMKVELAAKTITSYRKNHDVLENGFFVMTDKSTHLITTYKDLFEVVEGEFEEKGSSERPVIIRSDKIPRFDAATIIPVYKITKAVMHIVNSE